MVSKAIVIESEQVHQKKGARVTNDTIREDHYRPNTGLSVLGIKWSSSLIFSLPNFSLRKGSDYGKIVGNHLPTSKNTKCTFPLGSWGCRSLA